jgi:hypothetical protein
MSFYSEYDEFIKDEFSLKAFFYVFDRTDTIFFI